MFGERLKEIRKEKNLTLDELAAQYNARFDGGLNKGTLSKYENGKQQPMITVVNNLSVLLGVSTDWLLERTDEHTKSENLKLEEDLKSIILSRYKSLRAFTQEVDIPYSTVDTILKRGINRAGVVTMAKICKALDLDLEGLANGKLQKKSPTLKSAGEDEIENIALGIQQALLSAGFVKEGQELTSNQIDFLDALGDMLSAYFDKPNN